MTTEPASAVSSDDALATAYALPSSGPINTTELGNGVWLRPDLNVTSITEVMKNLQEWGIDNVYVDVFRGGETLYPSSVFPQRRDAVDSDWLAYIIDEAHAHDLRVHAWVQTLCWVEPGPYELTTSSLLQKNPGWADLNRDGRPFDGSSLTRFVSPAVPEVVSHLTTLTLELCSYDLDGINLDSIQYNNRADMGYHPTVTAEFEALTGIDPLDIEEDMARRSPWMQWTLFREDKLTSLVESISDACREAGLRSGRRVMLSALVHPGYEQTRGANRRYQNWGDWVRRGVIDATTPGCFAGELTGIEKQLWEVRSIHMGSDDVACVPGFQLDRFSVPETDLASDGPGFPPDAHPSLSDQMRLLRNAGFQHYNIMDYHALLLEKQNPEEPSYRRSGRFWNFFSRDNDDD